MEVLKMTSTSTDIPAIHLMRLSWHESESNVPNHNVYVNGWNGTYICKCRYDSNEKKWYDWENKEITIHLWKKWK